MHILDSLKELTKKVPSAESNSEPKEESILIDISDKDKSEVLAELYNNLYNAKTDTFSSNRHHLTIDQSRKILLQTKYIDMIDGYGIHIDFESDIIDVTAFNQEHGCGVAEKIISMCHTIK